MVLMCHECRELGVHVLDGLVYLFLHRLLNVVGIRGRGGEGDVEVTEQVPDVYYNFDNPAGGDD